MAKIWTTEMLARASGLVKSRIRQLLGKGEEIQGFKPPGSRDWLVEDEEARRWLKERGVLVVDEEELQ